MEHLIFFNILSFTFLTASEIDMLIVTTFSACLPALITVKKVFDDLKEGFQFLNDEDQIPTFSIICLSINYKVKSCHIPETLVY